MDACGCLFALCQGKEGEGDQLLLAHSNNILSYNLVNKSCGIITQGSFGFSVESSNQVL